MDNSTKTTLKTYIHEVTSDKEVEALRQHMDELGFSPEDSEKAKQWTASSSTSGFSANHDILDNISNLPPHSHSFLEIVQYKNPVGIEYFVGGRRYAIMSGDIVCAAPGTIHKVIIQNDDITCSRNVIVTPPEFLDQFEWPKDSPGFLLIRPDSDFKRDIRPLFEYCIDECNHPGPFHDVVFRAGLTLLLASLFRHKGDRIEAEKNSLLEEIIEYIDEHLTDSLTAKQVAKELYVSEKTIAREFSRYLDTSFHQYVTNTRLQKAVILIQSGASLQNAAEHVGYGDYATFYRAFVKKFGYSPKEIRK